MIWRTTAYDHRGEPLVVGKDQDKPSAERLADRLIGRPEVARVTVRYEGEVTQGGPGLLRRGL